MDQAFLNKVFTKRLLERVETAKLVDGDLRLKGKLIARQLYWTGPWSLYNGVYGDQVELDREVARLFSRACIERVRELEKRDKDKKRARAEKELETFPEKVERILGILSFGGRKMDEDFILHLQELVEKAEWNYGVLILDKKLYAETDRKTCQWKLHRNPSVWEFLRNIFSPFNALGGEVFLNKEEAEIFDTACRDRKEFLDKEMAEYCLDHNTKDQKRQREQYLKYLEYRSKQKQFIEHWKNKLGWESDGQ